MVATGLPPQYALLLELTRVYAANYCELARKISHQLGETWDERTAPFEVDVYFAYLVFGSMQSHKQCRAVWEELLGHLESDIVARHAARLSQCGDLRSVIAARVGRYMQAWNSFVADRRGSIIDNRLEWLLQHLRASAAPRVVEAKPPMIIGDSTEDFIWITKMTQIELRVAVAYECCLKHIFQRTDDIRTVHVSEIERDIRDGQEECKRTLGHTEP
jgi:hypothetical protein